jgi:hypothetical protein
MLKLERQRPLRAGQGLLKYCREKSLLILRGAGGHLLHYYWQLLGVQLDVCSASLLPSPLDMHLAVELVVINTKNI